MKGVKAVAVPKNQPEFGVRPSKFAACWWSLLEHDARLRTLTTLLEFAAVFTEVFKIR